MHGSNVGHRGERSSWCAMRSALHVVRIQRGSEGVMLIMKKGPETMRYKYHELSMSR